jgi:energy-coupling factor transporter ATP-binding protein EcfA2
MRISDVYLHTLAPFAQQHIKFEPKKPENRKLGEVHLFVGENGTGKTRLLSMLAAACGNPQELINRKLERAPGFVRAQFDNNSANFEMWYGATTAFGRAFTDPKTIPYGALSAGNDLFRKGVLPVRLAFRGSSRVDDVEFRPMAAVDLFAGDQLLFDKSKNVSPLIVQAMANLKVKVGMFLASQPDSKNNRNVRIAQRFEEAMTKVTGREFYFVVEDNPAFRVKVSWGGKRMFLCQLPDGLRSIIGWLVSCIAHMDGLNPQHEDPLDLPAILLIDEPELHLHPAWQRKVLPAVQSLLPNSQMFVATHSPFVISSVNEGFYYILRADEEGIVTCSEAKPCSPGDTYIDAVEDILGVTEWYDPETEAMLAEFREKRDRAKSSEKPDDAKAVKDLAVEIARRSDSLSSIMAKELAQFDRHMAK